jgi:hypothetical protein|uniref:Uncharacterized protein n=1 Tax=Candidatus Aramenus sulfurataquae TaxID=1326980 RepID=A0A0F2LRB8_9CREN|nr:hypothetical protein [Candidatus Aramenus sulfurataquae]
MVNRNKVYDVTSDQRYYIKQVATHLAYSDLEDAKKVANAMLQAWKSQFVEVYHAYHASTFIQNIATSLFSNVAKGAVIRYANYILKNMILTGVDDYNAVRSKLESQGIKSNYADALIAYSVCGAYSVPIIKGFIAQYNPNLANDLTSACASLPLKPTPDSPEIANVINAVSAHPMPSLARSTFYYYYRGLTQYSNVTAGSAGGEQPTAPTVTVLPAGPASTADALTKVLNGLNKYLG